MGEDRFHLLNVGFGFGLSTFRGGNLTWKG